MTSGVCADVKSKAYCTHKDAHVYIKERGDVKRTFLQREVTTLKDKAGNIL